ncbi:MAG: C-GCAxxG-C-C family protein [Desulfovibrionaceae bacterium]|nr:C-GCAxxG-C-C family protein [Desulfovibrionaceae bacterium]
MDTGTNITAPAGRRAFLKLAGGAAVAGAMAPAAGIEALAAERHPAGPALIGDASKIEAAILDLRRKRHSCSQATFAGICRALGGSLEDEQLLAFSAGFAGGIGKTYGDGTCGALTGGVMAAGLYLPGRTEEAVSAARELFERFKKREGTVVCGELLKKYGGFSNCTNCCVQVGRDAAALLNHM